ncbi:uncharacterized protein LOC143916764 isoform X2 [Arctopsyche grandis]|uniref:uncharacterized protein LOC143916764 isoform X2 n=1 Tax=Arctopsyche grandis TaxID=121162 RepID=UPI00406D6F64
MTPESLMKSWQASKHRMDVHSWLYEIGFYRKHIARDSSCLYRAVSEGLFSNQRMHATVRRQCAYYLTLTNNKMKLPIKCSIKDYADHILNSRSFGGFNEIVLLSHFYKRNFVIIDSRDGPTLKSFYNYQNTIYIFHQMNVEHFDILLPFDYIKKSSFCQAIAYQILYKGVFSISNIEYTTDKILECNTNYNDNKMLKIESKEKKDGDDCQNGHMNSNSVSDISKKMYQFPYKVARGLSPHVYKNIEFDVWVEMKREEEMSLNYHDGLTLQVGVKCLCKIKPDQVNPYVCYIQAMKQDGPCLVYVEELGEKRTVHFDQLKPLPASEAKPWYTNNKKGGAKTIRKFNIKRKKTSSVPDIPKLTSKTKTFFKSEDSKLTDGVKDSNNNSLTSDSGVFSASTCSTLEWDGGNVDKGVLNNVQTLEKFTRVDYYTFKPHLVEYVTMPYTVETNGRDNSGLNRQNSQFNFPPTTVATSCSNSCVPYVQPATNGTDVNNSTYTSSASTPAATPASIPSGNGCVMYNGNGCSPAYAPYTYVMPPMGVPLIRPHSPFPVQYSTRPPFTPIGVNYAVQRSINNNGSDLPYNDVQTLRFFFNLGIDYMQSGGMSWSYPPPPAPPTTPINNNGYYYQTTPNQLAQELQNVAIDDSPANSTQQDLNNKNNSQYHNNNPHKPNKFNEYKGSRGGYRGFRRNDTIEERTPRSNANFNRGGYNNVQKRNNARNETNGTSVENQDKNKNQDNQNQDSEHGNGESATTPNFPYIPYPPPSLYRFPYYPGEVDGSVMSNYPANYMFGSSDENSMPPPEGGYMPPPGSMPPSQYMTYISPPPPYYYSPSNGSNFLPPNFQQPPSAENQPLNKN